MPDRFHDQKTLTQEEDAFLDRACDAFEKAWRAGQRPSIKHVLAEAPAGAALRAKLLHELLGVEVTYRRQRGELPTPEEYRKLFPNDDIDDGWEDWRPPAWPRIPGYEIVAELGSGAMGIVYKALQLDPRRLVALKMIKAGVLATREQTKRFKIEIQALALCQHPNLATIFQVDDHEGLPYFSMQFGEGGSLDKKLDGKPQKIEEAATLVRTLAQAVQHAHDKGIVHRDLKPGNVVLTADGRPFLTDFGLAKVDNPDTTVDFSDSKKMLGTLYYMAPEVAAGQVKDWKPVDVYALGVILYEMLIGAPPFRGEVIQETLRMIREEEPAAPTLLRKEVPSDLETICLKCLEKRPEQRYASAVALAHDLNRFLDGEPIEAKPISEEERRARWARRAGFEIEELLTYGVRDIVYKARQVHLNRTVALKLIVATTQENEDDLDQLQSEAETVARLEHPNIVRIYDSGHKHGRTYLAFEYVGANLIEHYIKDHEAQPAPPQEAARLLQQLADAVHYAHQRGVLHGALKPSNILLTTNDVPKITNFGLSTFMQEANTERRPAVRPLPSYMAPELLDGVTGPAADIYALGAILYKLLTGGPPFRAETLADLERQVRTQVPPAPSTLRPGIPTFLDEVCLKCLAKDPARRYGSAGELTEEMVRYLKPPPDPINGEPLPTFPNYEVLRVLGRGSMSNVYEARQSASGQLRALKLFEYGEALLAMLQAVAESVSRIRHPNVIQVYEWGAHDGRPYFIMEPVPQGTLQTAAREMMPIPRTATLVRDLARGMEAVHRAGIIHGNLKPSKVLLDANGTPKITGFILARPQLKEDSETQTIADTAILGTPRYMAPEQLAGKIVPASDVHALGLIFYELLIGWLPYRAATLWDLANQIQRPPQSPRELRPEIPRELEDICLRCLDKKPHLRPSAGELADDIDRFLATKSVHHAVIADQG